MGLKDTDDEMIAYYKGVAADARASEVYLREELKTLRAEARASEAYLQEELKTLRAEARASDAAARASAADSQEMTKALRADVARLSGTAYKEVNIDILWNELLESLDNYVYKNISESTSKELGAIGKVPSVLTMFGPERLRSTFCNTYTDALKAQLKMTAGAMGVTAGTIKATEEWVASKCAMYAGMIEPAKAADIGGKKGMRWALSERLTAVEHERARITEPTQEQKNRFTFASTQFTGADTISKRVVARLQGAGYFVLYASLTGRTDMSDLSAASFKPFLNLISKNTESAPDTLNKFTRDCEVFFNHLAKQGYMPSVTTEKKQVVWIGELPYIKYEPGATQKKPHIAFELTISAKQQILPKECEVCKLYRFIRGLKKGAFPKELSKLQKDAPALLEICMRVNRETGLRVEFLEQMEWGVFSKKPVKTMPKGQSVYQVDLGDEDKGLRSLVQHRKELPDTNMYISGLLGKMVAKYRVDHPEVRDHYKVFNSALLFGKSATRTHTSVLNASTWRRDIVKPIEVCCGVNALPTKFRNSYYTIMLDALKHNPATDEFKRWTGDLQTTADKNYKAAVGVVCLPDEYIKALSYAEIVTHIFGRERVWDSKKMKWV